MDPYKNAYVFGMESKLFFYSSGDHVIAALQSFRSRVVLQRYKWRGVAPGGIKCCHAMSAEASPFINPQEMPQFSQGTGEVRPLKSG